jgi:predicted TIM-barrel fold metal-dependent hydrolase
MDDRGTRQVVISADGHCGADLLGYKEYLPARHHDDFDAWAASFHDPWAEEVEQARPRDNRSGNASMLTPLNWDSDLRLEFLDSQGIAAEVLFPNTAPPFYPTGVLTAPGPRTCEEYEQRFSGIRAHNRWLADFCSEAPERRAGFVQIFLDDVDDAIAEVRWAKEAGLRGVLLPGDHTLRMANLYYPRFDPLWAVCEELGLPVHRHAGFVTESVHEGGPASELVSFLEIEFYTMRAIGHMIVAGVFERFPGLRFVTTEISSAAGIAPFLQRMDGLLRFGLGAGTPMFEHIEGAAAALRRQPSEYYASNCYVGGPHDLRAARDAGIPNLMWGADIPHSEGCSPFTNEALRLLLADLPAEEIDQLLATRAADLYGFDLDALQAVADRIGPTAADLARPLQDDERPSYPAETCCTIFIDPGRFAAAGSD